MKLERLVWYTLPIAVTFAVVIAMKIIHWATDRGYIPENEGPTRKVIAISIIGLSLFSTIIIYLILFGEN